LWRTKLGGFSKHHLAVKITRMEINTGNNDLKVPEEVEQEK
jgi:hypothetical protein